MCRPSVQRERQGDRTHMSAIGSLAICKVALFIHRQPKLAFIPDNYPSGCAINDGEGRIRERPRTYRSHKALLWYNRKHRVSMG